MLSDEQKDKLDEIPIAIDSNEANREFLLAKKNESGTYALKSIPAFAYGFGLDDELEILDAKLGTVKLVERGRNITIRLFKIGTLSVELVEDFVNKIHEKGGVYEIARNATAEKESSLLLVSFPLSYGFKNIEEDMSAFDESSYSWEYGNVYDDDGNPLNWWK